MAVEDWLNGLKLAPKTKSHIKQLLHVIFGCAMRWELTDKNPISLVRVKGGSKRLKHPRILGPEEFGRLAAAVKEPATLLSIHPKTLQKMARAGTIPAYRIGDLWRFRASTLDRWLFSIVSSIQPLVPLNMKGNNV